PPRRHLRGPDGPPGAPAPVPAGTGGHTDPACPDRPTPAPDDAGAPCRHHRAIQARAYRPPPRCAPAIPASRATAATRRPAPAVRSPPRTATGARPLPAGHGHAGTHTRRRRDSAHAPAAAG